jgi:HAD superfamily hydrolase (TIGR01549 family)
VRAISAFRRERERSRGAPLLADASSCAARESAWEDAAAQGEPFQQQIARAAARLGMTPRELEALVQRYMIERPRRWLRLFRRRPLLAEIASFRRGGGRCALVSDYPARAKLAALGAAALFDVVIAAGEAGGPRRIKPDPEGLLRAAAELGVAPAACLVLGDRRDVDGAAARAAGMSFRRV